MYAIRIVIFIYFLIIILSYLSFTAEKKILNLVSQYEELKTTGRLKKHIQRLRKKNRHKERMKDENKME